MGNTYTIILLLLLGDTHLIKRGRPITHRLSVRVIRCDPVRRLSGRRHRRACCARRGTRRSGPVRRRGWCGPRADRLLHRRRARTSTVREGNPLRSGSGSRLLYLLLQLGLRLACLARVMGTLLRRCKGTRAGAVLSGSAGHRTCRRDDRGRLGTLWCWSWSWSVWWPPSSCSCLRVAFGQFILGWSSKWRRIGARIS